MSEVKPEVNVKVGFEWELALSTVMPWSVLKSLACRRAPCHSTLYFTRGLETFLILSLTLIYFVTLSKARL